MTPPRWASLGAVLLLLLLCLASSGSALDVDKVRKDYEDGMRTAQAGDLDAAERHFKNVVKAAPMLAEGYTSLAVVYEMGKKFFQSFQTYQEGMRQHPKHAELLKGYCITLLRTLQDGTLQSHGVSVEDCRSVCKKYKTLSPDNPEAYSSLGDMHTLLVEWEPAAANYNQALRIYNKLKRENRLDQATQAKFDPARTLSNLANCYSREGNVPLAIVSIAGSLKLRKADAHNLALYATISSTGSKFSYASRFLKRRSTAILAKGLTHKGESCPAGRWKVVYGWEDCVSGKIKCGGDVTIVNDGRRNKEYGLDSVTWSDPSDALTPYPTKYLERTVYAMHFDDVFVGGPSGTLHHNCMLFSGGHLEDARLHEAAEFGNPVDRIETVEGPVLSLLSQNLRNYYHYVVEGLARLLLAEKYLKLPKGTSFDDLTLLVPPNIAFVEPALEFLGFKNKLKHFAGIPNRIRVKSLYYVDWQPDEVSQALEESMPGIVSEPDPYDEDFWKMDHLPNVTLMETIPLNRVLAYDPWSVFYSSQEGLLLLRDRIHARLQAAGLAHAPTPKKWKLVYLSRADARANDFGIRIILNEHFLIDALRSLVGPENFVLFQGKNLPVSGQFEAFASAYVVVAPHGAGLANLVAAHPHTTFVLFPMKPHVDNTFGHMGAALSLDSHVVTSIHSYYYGMYDPLTKENVDRVVAIARAALTKRSLSFPDEPSEHTQEDYDTWLRVHNATRNKPSPPPPSPPSPSPSTKSKAKAKKHVEL
eukprot:m.182699 g.182699  ORF g.182699 m.182699 type:complete len:758 (-) comp17463_c1_seq2:2889-5162(-)